MKKFTTKDLVLSSIIGALYFVLVFVFSFMSYGDIQFRIAEVLLILVIFNPKLSWGIILGTFLSNLLNPLGFGIVDAVFGTLATAVGIIGLLIFRKKPIIGLLFPVLSNGIIVGLMLNVMIETPFLMNLLFVSFGQFVVLYALGFPLYYYLKKNNHLTEQLK